jgi:hypothetical protein
VPDVRQTRSEPFHWPPQTVLFAGLQAVGLPGEGWQLYRAAGRPVTASRLRKPPRPEWPDRLSGWTLPPPSARAAGELPVRVFESAEAAMAFLAGQLLASFRRNW